MALRTFTNKSGVEYDAENTEVLYAEDMNALTGYVDPSASKTAPVDADTVILTDSEASSARKKLTWAYIKSVLKTYFDGIYGIYNTHVTLSDGATPALDASAGGVFRLAAAGNRTIAVPSNAISGKKIVIEHYASGGARTLALNTGAGGFRFGTDITALTETASGKTDYIGCIYNTTDEKWDVVAYIKGF